MKNYSHHHDNENVLNRISMDINLFNTKLWSEYNPSKKLSPWLENGLHEGAARLKQLYHNSMLS
jgi:hypothetical protein